MRARRFLAAIALMLSVPFLTGCIEERPTVEVHCGVPGSGGGDVNILGNQETK